jgi:hypothetical protein
MSDKLKAAIAKREAAKRPKPTPKVKKSPGWSAFQPPPA